MLTVQDCLEQVAAFRASGQKANVWAEANNVPLRALAALLRELGR